LFLVVSCLPFCKAVNPNDIKEEFNESIQKLDAAIEALEKVTTRERKQVENCIKTFRGIYACHKKVVDDFEEYFIKTAGKKSADEKANVSKLIEEREMSRGEKM
jgi:sugar-specific transcriptional regulator TrmB